MLRTKLLFSWLEAGAEAEGVDRPAPPRALTGTELEIVEPFRALAGDLTQPDWAVYLSEVFARLAPKIRSEIRSWAKVPEYDGASRGEVIRALAAALTEGVPGTERVTADGVERVVLPADLINACWVATHAGARTPINRLTLKGLDTLNFIQHWEEAGGSLASGQTVVDAVDRPGALTKQEIVARLDASDHGRLVLTPRLPGSVKGASIDLRMGNRFIVFERSTAAAFDALDPRQDPRSVQVAIERAWGDVLYLHPGQLVLAATLEYMFLPADVTAQVITRSSYGRLGLISATAVQIHPHFAGCLTLELVNLGELPMVITPGERIAQLMLFTTTSPVPAPETGDEKYRYPTGPEFSKVRDDEETQILRNMRDQFDRRSGRIP